MLTRPGSKPGPAWMRASRGSLVESALGGLAVGRYVYAGKVGAYGAREACGRQKEHPLE